MVTGANGQLGKAVIRHLPNDFHCVGVDITPEIDEIYPLDLTDASAVRPFLRKVDPDIIVNLAALTDVDRCEREPELSHAVNVNSLKLLSRTAPEAYILHISSDYVFDGRSGPYGEEDRVNPINIYGKHKLESESICLSHSGGSAVIRTNVVFDYMPTTQASFVKWVIDALQRGEDIRIVKDQWNNPTWTNSLSTVINRFVTEKYSGLYHYGGRDWLNRYEFALMIARVFDLNPRLIHPISTQDLHQDAPRPLKCGLKTDLIRKKFGLMNDPLEACLSKIKLRLIQSGIM